MATRTISNAGGDWSSAGTWVEGAAPTAADDVVATATSGNVTVSGTSNTCKTLILTGYTGTLNFSLSTSKLTVAGHVTLAGTITAAYTTAQLITTATCTLTSNGIVWPCEFQMATAGAARTLADDWTFMGVVRSSSTFTLAGVGRNVYLYGGLDAFSASAVTTTISANVHAMAGTYKTTGASSFTFSGTGGLNIEGDISFDQYFNVKDGAITWVSGTVTSPTTILGFYGTNGTAYNCGANAQWHTLMSKASSGRVDLASDIYVTTLVSCGALPLIINGAYNVRNSGGVSGTSSVNGTATMLLCGTGAISTAVTLSMSTTIDTVGTITFASGSTTTIGSLKTYTYTAGTVITAGHFLRIWGTGTYAFNGVVWDYVKIDIANGQTSTLTFGSDLNAATVDVNNTGTAILAGAYSVACGTYRQCVGSTVQLSSDTRLAVSGNLIVNGSDVLATTLSAVSGNPVLCYTGALGGLRAYSLTLTNIDASSSAIPVCLLWGTAAGCANVSVMTSAQLAVDVFGSFG